MFSEGGAEGPKGEGLFVLIMFEDGTMGCDPEWLRDVPPRPKLRKAAPQPRFKILHKIFQAVLRQG